MKFGRSVALIGMVGLLGLLGGCRSVETTFVNNTSEPLELEITGPGSGVGHLGTIPASGQLRTLIEVHDAWLPATYTITAGKHSQTFSIASDSKDRITINIPADADSQNPTWRLPEGKKKIGSDAPVIYKP